MATEATGLGSVSVIIPVYNGERFVRRALESVLAQSRPASQILVVDDGSKDDSCGVVEREYAGRVTLIRQTNGGPAKARNTGLRAATGEYVAFLDADDWWQPEKLEMQLRELALHPEAAGNYTGLRIVDESDAELELRPPFPPASLMPTLRWCNPGIPPSSVVLRRAALDALGFAFDERVFAGEDWGLWFRLTGRGGFCVCPEPLTNYRTSAGGLSGDARLVYDDFLKILDDTLLTGMTGVRRALWRRRILSFQAFKACLTARAAGDKKSERAYMKRSLVDWPSPFWASERFRCFAVTLMRT